MVVFAISIVGILGNTVINAPLPDIVAYFGRGDGAAGLIVAAATLPGIFVAPAVGILADRFGRRTVIVPCLVVFGLSGLGSALAPSFEVLVALRFAQGVGAAGLINLAVVLIADSWDGVERARVIGLNAAVLTISVAILPAVGGLLAAVGGWRWAFAPFGLALLVAVAVLRYVGPGSKGPASTVRAQIRGALVVARNPSVIGAITFGTLFFVLAFGLMLTVLPLMLEQRYGLSVGVRGLVFIFPALGATLVATNIGRLRHRFGASQLLVAGAALFAVGYAAMGLLPVLALVLVGAFIHGLGEGATIPTVQDVVAAAAPKESRGAVVALWVGSARIGQTIGPLLAASTVAAVGFTSTFALGVAMASLLSVGTAVLVARTRRAAAVG